MKHTIVKGATTVERHRDLVGKTVTLTCTCGTKARSKAGFDGAFSAFDKHVARAAR